MDECAGEHCVGVHYRRRIGPRWIARDHKIYMAPTLSAASGEVPPGKFHSVTARRWDSAWWVNCDELSRCRAGERFRCCEEALAGSPSNGIRSFLASLWGATNAGSGANGCAVSNWPDQLDATYADVSETNTRRTLVVFILKTTNDFNIFQDYMLLWIWMMLSSNFMMLGCSSMYENTKINSATKTFAYLLIFFSSFLKYNDWDYFSINRNLVISHLHCNVKKINYKYIFNVYWPEHYPHKGLRAGEACIGCSFIRFCSNFRTAEKYFRPMGVHAGYRKSVCVGFLTNADLTIWSQGDRHNFLNALVGSTAEIVEVIELKFRYAGTGVLRDKPLDRRRECLRTSTRTCFLISSR